MDAPEPPCRDQRIALILSHINPSDRIIDVGCAHHSADRHSDPYWLHQHIASKAKDTIGVEIEKIECEKLEKIGYRVVCGDIENPSLVDTLGIENDVIVAGELIEHLSNPGLFLKNSYSMLKPGGLLIISTPNPWNFFNILSVVFRGKIPIHTQHTAWFDDKTLSQLVSRFGYKIELFEYLYWMRGQKGETISRILYALNFKRLAGAGILLVLRK